MCSMRNSAVATIVTSNIKGILLTIVGLFIFSDININIELISGIVISVFGALIFCLSKLKSLIKREKTFDNEIKIAHELKNDVRELQLRNDRTKLRRNALHYIYVK